MSTVKKNPFETKFHNEFTRLVENLLKIYEGDKQLLSKIKKFYLYYKKDVIRSDFVHDMIDIMEIHIDNIKIHNEEMFSDAQSPGEVCLLGGNLNIKDLWRSPLLEDKYKENIWSHLKNLYLLGCHYIERQNEHMREIMIQLKTEAMLKKDMLKKDQEKDEKRAAKEGDGQLLKEMMGLFTELFGEQSFIHEVLKIDEIHMVIEEFKTNPARAAKLYLANNCKHMKETLEKVADKVKEKVISGDIDTEKIQKDVKKIHRMLDKLKKQLISDPKFSDVLDHIKKILNIDLRDSKAFDNPSDLVDQFCRNFAKMADSRKCASPDEAAATTGAGATGAQSDNTTTAVPAEAPCETKEEMQKLTEAIIDLGSIKSDMTDDEFMSKLNNISPDWEKDFKMIKETMLGQAGDVESLGTFLSTSLSAVLGSNS